MGFSLRSLIPFQNWYEFAKYPTAQNFGRAAVPIWGSFSEPDKPQQVDPYAAQREVQALAQKQLEERQRQQTQRNSAIAKLFEEKNKTPSFEQRDEFPSDALTPQQVALDLSYHPNESEVKRKGFRGLVGLGGRT